MKAGLLSLVACLACCVAGLAVSPVSALGESSPPAEGTGVSSSSLGSPLVTLGSPIEAQQARAVEEAKLASPEGVAAREESQTKYEGLDDAQAREVDATAFPVVIDEPAGGLPRLSAGESVAAYPADNVAQLVLPGGRHGVVESLEPIAVQTGPGQRVPIDLGLGEAGGAFEPKTPLVAVRIPKSLSAGVSLGGTGVSLTPVTAQGSPLGGSEGAVDGASVLYANTQTDTDTVVKPTTAGFEVDTMLRSIDSPEQLFFRVGLPEGASLVQAKEESGAVEIVKEGTAIAAILPAGVQDAAGTQVPVSMGVAGDMLTLTVDHRVGEYRYPITVDPTVTNSETVLETGTEVGDWVFTTTNKAAFKGGAIWRGAWLSDGDEGAEYASGEYGFFQYLTQGVSRIYAINGRVEDGYTPEQKNVTNIVGLRHHNGEAEVTDRLPLAESQEVSACVEAGCAPAPVTSATEGNAAIWEQEATASGGEFKTDFNGPAVSIEQEQGPTSANFDTKEEKLSYGLENPLYGNRWASSIIRKKWGFAGEATDPGIGIYKETISSPNAPKWGMTSTEDQDDIGECRGVQCKQKPGPWTYNIFGRHAELEEVGAEHLPEGEDTIEFKAEDAVGLSSTTATAKVKIDNTPPHITLSGLPSGNEINFGQHIPLTVSATDGSGPPSSGVASIAVTIDGKPVTGSPFGGCSPGTCTSHGEWALHSEEYAVGKHVIIITATDNAGNVAKEEYPITIRSAPPVGVGPGSVNSVTGELGLTATDVSVSASGTSLTVGRSYSSRHLTLGGEGPLGPQWSMSLGASASVSRTPSGSMILTSASGGQSIFASNGKGGYTPPAGDAGLILTEKVVGTTTDFLLSEDGTTTTFAVPAGGSGSVWEPSISEGTGGTNVTTFAYKTEGGVTEPTEELAPVPAGVSCSPALTKGCRALSFVYATKTKESIGEGPSEWGEYKGRLAEVTFTAYEPLNKEMRTKSVAEYVYDKQGRLRAVWNPQVSPALKTVYGYDSEGHVTALAPAGQQPWLIEQGTTASDAGTGRVLAVARPAATSEAVLKTEMEAAAPVNTVAPTLSSTTPTVGVKISVSGNGTWSNSPLAYSYEWEDCSTSGPECTVIPGAVNQSYYPVASDEGHKLVAEVVALNADGSVTAPSGATSVVAKGTPSTPLPEPPSVGSLSVWTIDYQVPLSGTEAGLPKMSATEVAKWGQTDVPVEATAVFPPDEPMGWPAKEYKRASIYYLDSHDRSVNVSSPTGGIATTEYNGNNDVIRTLSPDNRADALAAGEEKAKEVSKELDTENTYNEEEEEGGAGPGTELLSTLGPKHAIELTNGTKTEGREHTVYTYNQGAPGKGQPYDLITKMTQGAEIAGKEEAASVRTTTTSYSGQEKLGWTLRKPTSVTTEPNGLKLIHRTAYEAATGNVIETRLPAGEGKAGETGTYAAQFGSEGKENGQFKSPRSVAVAANGDVYVVDASNYRVQEFSSTGTYITQWGSKGTENGQFEAPRGIAIASNGDVYVTDESGERVQEFSSSGTYITQWGSEGKENGQFQEPHGVAVASNGDVYVADTHNNRVQEFTATGTYIKQWGSSGTENGQFKSPQAIAIAASGDVYVTGNEDRVQEFSPTGEYITKWGSEGKGYGQLSDPAGIAVAANGNVYVADTNNDRMEEFSSTGEYVGQFGTEGTGNGQFKAPRGVALAGSTKIYVADSTNDRIQEFTPSTMELAPPSPHDTQTIYYTSAANATYPGCGEHAEWAGLTCQTQPVIQPEDGLPNLQVTTYTYNIWDEPATTTNTSGTTTRKTTDTYDAAGRLKTTATTSTVGTALPTITYKYNTTIGALEEQSNGGKTKPIVSDYNTLGQMTSYTDATESTTTYEYDVDGRITKVNDGKGTETYTYNKTTGLLTELLNEYGTSKLLFTATYDSEGNMLTEGYPNGMTASYTYDATGKPISVEYKKMTHCTEKCTWFSDNIVPSIHGQWLEQTSTLSHQAYTYDGAGRLTQVQNTPTGKGCTTRIYAYDADTNRTSLTTREPNAKGECASEGGTVENHTYDAADRLTDAGVSYNTFGDITSLPAADVGGKESSENLTSVYYVDNQVASQTQNGETIGYNLDPAGRTLEVISSGKTASTVTNHYAGPDQTPAWASNTTSETTRNISGINGILAATQNNTEAPELQLTNLHGDIIAKAYLSETATGLASTVDTSEYGVPTTSLPSKYSWLGALEIPTELPSGVMNMGARSYVPELGRFLQPDPIPGGSANAYSYTFGDPVNTSDPSGAYATGIDSEITGAIDAEANQEAGRRAAEQAAAEAIARAFREEVARREAESAAYQAMVAAYAAGPQYAGGEEWGEEEWFEEEGGYEYASYHQGGKEGHEAAHVEPAVLVQPLQESASEAEAKAGAVVRLCQDMTGGSGKTGPCARYAWFGSGVVHWVTKHIIRPVEHFVHEIATNLPKCYPDEIKGGGQCSSAPPGWGDDPFYPVF
jgi:RHS repeat-associated protein